MEKIKFAVIGCGHIGRRHAAVIQENDQAELVAICDVKSLKELKLPENLAQVNFYQKIEDLIRNPKLQFDVACICTPNYLHASQALELLDAKKHVVIEKPMGLKRSECEKVVHKGLTVSRNIFIVMQNRYSPPIQLLKKLVKEQTLGDIYNVQIQCYWNRDDRYYMPDGQLHEWHGKLEKDGGVLFTQFSHFIDIMYWIFGDFEDIQSRFANFSHQHSTEFPDTGSVQFKLENGALGTLNFSTAVWDQNFESSITVIGEKGTIKIGGQYMDRLDYCHIQDYVAPTLPPSKPANQYKGYQGSASNHAQVIDNVIDVIRGHKTIATNALEGMKTVEIIERIYNSYLH
ncbi:MAG: Gfo/Idh/MocA family oxidoreductase [Saprospiraceae bacterium]